MNRIKNHFSSFLTAICSALLSFLGYGCSSSPENQPEMYGMPTGDFEIKGSVTTEAGKAVDNADIRVTAPSIPSGEYSFQSTKTNEKGEYIAVGQSYGEQELKVVCIPNNLDLESDSVIIKLDYNKDNADFWYSGYAEETVNFQLKEKKQ